MYAKFLLYFIEFQIWIAFKGKFLISLDQI